MLSAQEVRAGWQAFLGRLPNDDMLNGHMRCTNRADLVARLSRSEEFQKRLQLGYTTLLDAVVRYDRMTAQHVSFQEFTAPSVLARSPDPVRNCLIVGACLLQGWAKEIALDDELAAIDFVLIARNGEIARQAPRPFDCYDCAILQVPLRMVLHDRELFGRSYADTAGYEEAFARCVEGLRTLLPLQLEQLAGRPVFVLNYMVPMQSALGRLLPRYDLRNPSFFIEELNRALAAMLAGHNNVHLLDVDQLSATIGRRLIQDDPFAITSHSSLVGDYDFGADRNRLEPSLPLSQRLPRETGGFVRAAWAEVQAMMRTLRGLDSVKLVCVDIDDTLWRGVAAEMDEPDPVIVEGWPLGFAEALAMLKRRGVILALVSKNDPARVAEIWPKVFNATLKPDDFAIHKINWNPKPENVAQAIAEANVLPEAVVFIDDNSAERAAVQGAIPGIRTLGAPHLDWRRVLLWSPQTQVADVTDVSARRTEMVRAQGQRESERSRQPREEFLVNLELEVDVACLEDPGAPAFPRAFELINKTNQFNTTGKRWSYEEATDYLRGGGRWWHFAVRDRFTAYGLVGVVAERSGVLDQFVLSCRVFGLGIEQAVLSALSSLPTAGEHKLIARLIETPRNNPCRSVYLDAGWQQVGDVWRSPGPIPAPPHVRLTLSAPKPISATATPTATA